MNYVYLGKIVNTHALKGELRILSSLYEKDLILKPGLTLYIGPNYEEKKIITYRVHKNFDMVLLEDVDTIDKALTYKTLKVYLKREDIKLPFLLEELVKLNVYENDVLLGTTEEIVYNNGNNLLKINDFYLPINDHFIKNVSLIDKRIDVVDTKGLRL